MSLRSTVADNLGYALVGGPSIAFLAFAVSGYAYGLGVGLVVAAVVYTAGWALALRQSNGEREPDASPGADEDDARTLREEEARKAEYHGDF
ncbi:hypothetical protein ACOZ4B_19920 [Haloferax prahovense]|uniref:hypothetical protein n=1 Tax=Haloferax prahovense TaxID=381852 RepID=UPI003C759493